MYTLPQRLRAPRVRPWILVWAISGPSVLRLPWHTLSCLLAHCRISIHRCLLTPRSCEFVVRYNAAATGIQLLQSRGRARKQQAAVFLAILQVRVHIACVAGPV